MQTVMQTSLANTPFVAGGTCRRSNLGSIAGLTPAVNRRAGRSALVVRAEKPQVQSYVHMRGV